MGNNNIREKIISYIDEKGLKVGSKLPSEAEFSKILEVSKLTLRETLNVLRGEGFLTTVHGKGTYISSDFKHISDTLNNNLGITEMIEMAGYKSGTKEFERNLVSADKEIAKSLLVPEGSDVLVCKRIRTADGNNVIYSIDYFAPHLVSDFLKIKDSNVSIYSFIEKDSNIKIDNSIAEILPYKCNEKVAKKLDYEAGEAILMLKQTISDEKGKPLLFAIEYLRPDCFRLLVNRRRKK